MPRRWNSRGVLRIVDDQCYIENVPTQQRNCLAPIPQRRLNKFDKIIAVMSRQQPSDYLPTPQLQDLAKLGLCRQRHQDQVDEIVDKWSGLMRTHVEDARPQGTEHVVAELAIRRLLRGLQVDGHMLRRDVDTIVSEQMDKPS